MKKSKIQVICGLKVVDMVLSEDSAGVVFENEVNLIIYNKFILIGVTSYKAKKIIGKVVIGVEENEFSVTINFEDSLAIKIDMNDEAYSVPEAMQLLVPGEPIVIWN